MRELESELELCPKLRQAFVTVLNRPVHVNLSRSTLYKDMSLSGQIITSEANQFAIYKQSEFDLGI